jgi:hypothetical protein
MLIETDLFWVRNTEGFERKLKEQDTGVHSNNIRQG